MANPYGISKYFPKDATCRNCPCNNGGELLCSKCFSEKLKRFDNIKLWDTYIKLSIDKT